MPTFYIRNIPIDIANKIDRLAKDRELSRNDFVNIILSNIANEDITNHIDNKYNYLLNIVINELKTSREIIGRNDKLFERILNNDRKNK